MRKAGVNFDYVQGKNYLIWLGSVGENPDVFKEWVDDELFKLGKYPTVCQGDSGAPLFFWDKKGLGEIFLIGMITGTRQWKECGLFGVDIAVSMLGLVEWLELYIDNVPDPRRHDPYECFRGKPNPNKCP